MAFTKELEELINATLADGVITEKERAVLRKKALLEGVDPDEVDVVIDGRLQQLQNEVDQAKQKIRKCPACGEIIPAMSAVCPSCGYIIDTSNAENRALKEFMDQLNTAFQALADGNNKHRGKYVTELELLISKGKMLYGDNPKIKSMIFDAEEKLRKDNKKHLITRVVSLVLIAIAVIALIWYCNSGDTYQTTSEKIESQYDEISKTIDNLPTPTVANYDECVREIAKISWKEIDVNRYSDDVQYQIKQKQSAQNKLNTYIRLMQKVQPEYVRSQTGKIIKNPKFVEEIDWINDEESNTESTSSIESIVESTVKETSAEVENTINELSGTKNNSSISSQIGSSNSSVPEYVEVTGVNLRLRKAPSLKADTYKWPDGTNRHPDKGQILKCIGQQDGFYNVEFDGVSLWISQDYAQPVNNR